MKKKILQPLVTVLLIIGGFGILFQWGSAGVSPKLVRLENILALLELDPVYLWKLRPNLNTIFENTTVITDAHGFRLPKNDSQEQSGRLQVYCFGASPTFGYGVEAVYAYPKVAERFCTKAGLDISARNMGQIGYSSHQGRLLFESIISSPSKPDIATVSYMVNDLDRLRFFKSDGKDDAATKPLSNSRVWMYNHITSRGPMGWLSRHNRRVLSKILKSGAAKKGYALKHIRVPLPNYKQNLTDIANVSKSNGVALVFVMMPFKLAEPVSPLTEAQSQKFATGIIAMDDGDLGRAQKIFLEIVSENDKPSAPHYLLAQTLEQLGMMDEATHHYRIAFTNLIYDCALDADTYNQAMKEVAIATGTPIIEAANALGDETANMDYFVPGDYIHPNEKGHKIIGECLAKRIIQINKGEQGTIEQRCGD